MSPFEPCLFDADAPRPALISGIAYMYGWHTSSVPRCACEPAGCGAFFPTARDAGAENPHL
jgi:hypothetical protein